MTAIRPFLRDQEESPQAARRVALRIAKNVVLAATHPSLGRPGRCSNTRELVISGTPYIVAYRTRGNLLEVLAVLHAAMNWPDEL